MKDTGELSPVERTYTEAPNVRIDGFPTERIPVVVVGSFPVLGQLTALRFIEWTQDNPEGVVSLPTGKTPQHFIEQVQRVTSTWDEPDTRALLEQRGISPARRPDLRGLRFVQIDEFYPIESSQHNSFNHYIKRFYIDGFGLDSNKALLIDASKIGLDPGQTLRSVWPDLEVDLTLRHRSASSKLEEVQQRTLMRIDQWCGEYEARIRALGGIGFFLGGIGPDGHIGFNIRGSDHFSTTRLTPTNYETQAAAATDLGGIEVARKRLVITIGLGTICHNPDCVAIIMAAGETKAPLVADAIQKEPSVLFPATALTRLKSARFYITQGAARNLAARQYAEFSSSPLINDETVERTVIDLCVKLSKRLDQLERADFEADAFARQTLEKARVEPRELAGRIRENVIERVERGAKGLTDTSFLHTEPHHDDIMLGYLPAVVRNTRTPLNSHHFATLTSGFTAVTNDYMRSLFLKLRKFLFSPELHALVEEGYFDSRSDVLHNRDVWQYLDGVAAYDALMKEEGEVRRQMRNLQELTGKTDLLELQAEVDGVIRYLENTYPGKKDPDRIQQLKGMVREWEAECLWGYFGWSRPNVHHLRLGFYKGDIFTEDPTLGRDVPPILALIEEARPNVISIAFDPEGSGPDTHYKVMRAIHAAIEIYLARHPDAPRPTIWGYRNVWYRFHPAEANLYVPVTLNMLSILESAFINTFISQREASFPSPEFDGPFSKLSQKIQVEQYQTIKTCLGRAWFNEHPSALIRCTRGLVFIKEMDVDRFYGHSRHLQQAAETI